MDDVGRAFDALKSGQLAQANAALKAKGLAEIAVPAAAPEAAGGRGGGEKKENERWFERD